MLPYDCRGGRNRYSRNAAAFALHPRAVSRHRLSQCRFVRPGPPDNCPGVCCLPSPPIVAYPAPPVAAGAETCLTRAGYFGTIDDVPMSAKPLGRSEAFMAVADNHTKEASSPDKTCQRRPYITKPVLIGESDGQFNAVWKTPGIVPRRRLVGLPARLGTSRPPALKCSNYNTVKKKCGGSGSRVRNVATGCSGLSPAKRGRGFCFFGGAALALARTSGAAAGSPRCVM
jgi:hypothetical protein